MCRDHAAMVNPSGKTTGFPWNPAKFPRDSVFTGTLSFLNGEMPERLLKSWRAVRSAHLPAEPEDVIDSCVFRNSSTEAIGTRKQCRVQMSF